MTSEFEEIIPVEEAIEDPKEHLDLFSDEPTSHPVVVPVASPVVVPVASPVAVAEPIEGGLFFRKKQPDHSKEIETSKPSTTVTEPKPRPVKAPSKFSLRMEAIKHWFKLKFSFMLVSISIICVVIGIVKSLSKIKHKTEIDRDGKLPPAIMTNVYNVVLAVIILMMALFSLPNHIENIYNRVIKYIAIKKK